MAKNRERINGSDIWRVVDSHLSGYFSVTFTDEQFDRFVLAFDRAQVQTRIDFWAAYAHEQTSRELFVGAVQDALECVVQVGKDDTFHVREFARNFAVLRQVLALTLRNHRPDDSVHDSLAEVECELLDVCARDKFSGAGMAADLIFAEQRAVVRGVLGDLEKKYSEILLRAEYIQSHVQQLLIFYQSSWGAQQVDPLMHEVSVAREPTMGMELDRLLELVVQMRLLHARDHAGAKRRKMDVVQLIHELQTDQGNRYFTPSMIERIVRLAYDAR